MGLARHRGCGGVFRPRTMSLCVFQCKCDSMGAKRESASEWTPVNDSSVQHFSILMHLDLWHPQFSMFYLKDGVSFRKLHLFITHYLCDPSQNINITKTKQKFICSVFHVCCYHKPTLRQGTECGRHHRHDCCTHLSQSLKAKLAAPPQFLADSLNPFYSLWLQTLASGENSLRGK